MANIRVGIKVMMSCIHQQPYSKDVKCENGCGSFQRAPYFQSPTLDGDYTFDVFIIGQMDKKN